MESVYEEKLWEFVRSALKKQKKNSSEWTKSSSFFKDEFFDSIFFVELVLFLESEFGVSTPQDLKKEDLESIDKVLQLIARMESEMAKNEKLAGAK